MKTNMCIHNIISWSKGFSSDCVKSFVNRYAHICSSAVGIKMSKYKMVVG